MSELMTLEDIAATWKASRKWVQRYLVKKPGFPSPAPGSTRKNPRWRGEDIQQFLKGEPEHA